MKLSQQNRIAIQKYFQDFFTKLSYPDIFKTLLNVKFLSDYEFEHLQHHSVDNMPRELVTLLYKKSDSDFLGFCMILQQSQAASYQELGASLRQEAKKIGKADKTASGKYLIK